MGREAPRDTKPHNALHVPVRIRRFSPRDRVAVKATQSVGQKGVCRNQALFSFLNSGAKIMLSTEKMIIMTTPAVTMPLIVLRRASLEMSAQ